MPLRLLLFDRRRVRHVRQDLRLVRQLGRAVSGGAVGLVRALLDRSALGADAHCLAHLGGLHDRDRDVLLVALRRLVDLDGRAGRHGLREHLVRERVLDVALDGPAERACAHGRVPALLDEEVRGLLGEVHRQLPLGERLADPLEQQLDDGGDLLLRELVEDDDLVDPVQELGPEHLLQLAHDPGLHVLVGDAGLVADGEPDAGVLGDLRRAHVRGHDHDRVAEVHRAPLGAREASVLEDLEQDVEHVRVRLLDLVEQEHAVRLAPHGLGELAALVVSDVAGRGADQPRHGMLLHVLGHVDADHRLFVAEQELGERAGELGLPDARGAQEDERAGRPLRVLQAGPRAADGLRDRLDGGVLPDDALVELVLHAHELLRLGFGQLEDRDAGPHGDDVGDLLLADLRALSGLAGTPLLLELALLVGELALLVAQVRSLFELLRLDRGLLVAPRRLDVLLEVAVHGRGRHRLDARARRGLVDEVDRLVGQEAVRDVAVRELGRGLERLVGDADAVVLLVAVAEPLQDLDGVVLGGLVHADLLEAALERGVALEVLAVFVERGRANRLELATGERRLEDAGRVDRALGGAGADEVVELVDEQDDVAALGDLLHHLLEALLELAAVLRARHERGQVERVDLLVLQQLRHLAVRDQLGEALDHGGLAHARLADQDRVVLLAAREDLHDPLDLGLAAHDRVQLALGGELGQIAAELVEQLRGLLALALGAGARAGTALAATGAGEHADDLVADLLGVGVEVEQDARGNALVLADQSEQDVLGADVVVAKAERLAQGELQHLLGARGERDLAGGDLLARAHDADHLGADALHRDVEALEDAGGKPLLFAKQAEQDVLGADVIVLENPGLLLGEDDHLASPFGEALKHAVLSYLSGTAGAVLTRSFPPRSALTPRW